MRNNSTIKGFVTERGLCSGCGICESLFKNNIAMVIKEAGLYRPKFKGDLSEEEWSRLMYVCPALNMNYRISADERVPLYGKAINACIGWAEDNEIRYQASSGGVTTALLMYLLDNKIIDGVIHVKRGENQLEASAGLSISKEEVRANTGSLYMPVSLLKDIVELFNQVDRVAIVGKGCDVRAIRRYIEINPQYSNKVIVCIGILCGGTPSIWGTYRILDEFGVKADDVVRFRYRGYGWPGACTVTTKDGEEHSMSYNDAWANRLGPTSPLVCKICFDGVAEEADISIGDAWLCEDGNAPSFEEAKGRNLLISRSAKGNEIIQEAARSRYICLAEDQLDENAFLAMQPSQSNRRYLALYKVLGLRLLGYIHPKVNMRYLLYVAKTDIVRTDTITKIRTICGSVKRAIHARERQVKQ